MTSIKIYGTLTCIVLICILKVEPKELRKFPDKFQFGVATASYQVEGGWNASDKGENIWDRLVHTTDLIVDRSTGDIACDSYNQHKRDIEMLVELGVDFYRFSLSWSRLLPNGFADKISADGLRYYNELINDLIAVNITPTVTLFHWDLPQSLQDLGGWTNPLMEEYFTDYVIVAFREFGDRVKTWITFNEPWTMCVEGYGGLTKAPAINKSGIADYLCAHHMIKAHAKVYHLYDNDYRKTQKGRIGIALNSGWFEPISSSAEDLSATKVHLDFNLGWFARPIFHTLGDYPPSMKREVAKNSIEQGFPKSRLPTFTEGEVEYIRGTSDFFGLNHYTTYQVEKSPNDTKKEFPSYWDDIDAFGSHNESWPGSASYWLKVVPWGFTRLLSFIKSEYNDPEIIIYENGFSDVDEIDDFGRINYYNQYLNAMLDAIEAGVNVSSYTAWSLMDNFEWIQGYTERFGLYYVDFNDSSRPRIPKKSALYYKKVIASRAIEKFDDKSVSIGST